MKNFDALGSRLHLGNDGIWYAYAQWKSAEHRERAFAERKYLVERDKMGEAIEEVLPEILLETVSDFLLFPDKTQ